MYSVCMNGPESIGKGLPKGTDAETLRNIAEAKEEVFPFAPKNLAIRQAELKSLYTALPEQDEQGKALWMDTNALTARVEGASFDAILPEMEASEGNWVPGMTEKEFHKDFWADQNIYDVLDGKKVINAERVTQYNARTERAMAKYGVALVEKDPTTGLWVNPILSADPTLRLLHGRGGLGKYGINEAVDLRVRIEGTDTILTFKRPKDGGYAVPGGMVDYGETAVEAVKREFREEIGDLLPKGYEPKQVGAYIVADRRNTALSWIGTTLFEVTVSAEMAEKMKARFKETREALEPDFRSVGALVEKNEPFFASHKELVTIEASPEKQ